MRRITTIFIFSALFIASGHSTAAAQNDTISSPLIAITGPNVLPKGGVQWNNEFGFMYRNSSDFMRYGYLTMTSNLRLGIGGMLDFNATFEGGLVKGVEYNSGQEDPFRGHSSLTSLGLTVKMYEGRGVIPQMSFRTDVTFPTRYIGSDSYGIMVAPKMQLNCRNLIGSKWVIDYVLGYSWHDMSFQTLDEGLYYSLSVNRRFGDKWIAGLCFGRRMIHAMSSMSSYLTDYDASSNHVFSLSAMYQATPQLQLSMQGNVTIAGIPGVVAVDPFQMSANVLFGVHWMIK